jgi:hypothetical protein
MPVDMPDPWLVPEFLRLNPAYQSFVKAYLTDASGNATAAALATGYQGKHPRNYGCRALKNPAITAAITACRPVLHAMERWEARNPLPAPVIEAVGRKLRPRWKRRDMIRWLESVAEGVDPDFKPSHDPPCDPRNRCPGCLQPPIPWDTRTKTGKMLIELRDWAKRSAPVQRHVHAHKVIQDGPTKAGPRGSLEAYARSLPTSALLAELDAVRERNTVKVPALTPAASEAVNPQPKDKVTDAETETD